MVNHTALKPLDDPVFGEGECVVAWGSVQFIKHVERRFPGRWTPGFYARMDNLSYAAFGAHYGDLMMNDDFVIMPFAEFVRRNANSGRDHFIRPNRVTKAFTGLVVKADDFDHEVNSLRRLSNVNDDELVVVAAPKIILGEARFIICGNEVVTGSTYGWDRTLDVRSDVHPSCREVADEVAKRDWKPDTVFTCDVALAEIDGKSVARLLELNAFSCSGLYACDTSAIIDAVGNAARREHSGDV
ncbi:ATP-grasp domain-containing protein [Roseibium sp. RKSG952]|uniref:ATP-grasp domain-containing protein n=1 Tax=Roseibium sp. RKSG952 TaxID=2529384 RepID=UPI0018AD1A13